MTQFVACTDVIDAPNHAYGTWGRPQVTVNLAQSGEITTHDRKDTRYEDWE
jgi:hypothetical protein